MKTSGSETAKQGFLNEKDVVEKFKDWRMDSTVQEWLNIMQYDLTEIEYVDAFVLHGYKTDVQVQVTIKLKNIIDAQNLQVKLVSNPNGCNQVDKRWVDTYAEMWNMPENISTTLKHYTGEYLPTKPDTRDPRRMYLDEMECGELVGWFEDQKLLIISDIMKGRGKFAAEWILVALKVDDSVKWSLTPMNVAMNHYNQGNVSITSQGNLKIGKITVQRKGGDSGKKTAQMLQFKLNPVELFEIG